MHKLQVIRQLLRFSAVGLFTNLTAIAFFHLITSLYRVAPDLLVLCFYFGGMFLNLVLNNRYTFSRNFLPASSILIRAVLMYAVGAVCNYFIMHIGVNALQMSPTLCFAVAVVIMPAYFFLVSRYFVYAHLR